ncbi:hypothetical protein [uncultured Ruegeria sp.]|uniref:hypothetical protein n=1 Tax=uncultured Ruegeria sp. TaxID=259304 RepID=UPI002629B120|nr:hypothetical protein [uncultured Ruegeria sp.]
MSHAEIALQLPRILPRSALAIVLAGLLGFALGQSWPTHYGGIQDQIRPSAEDWHGNVRRSYWPE